MSINQVDFLRMPKKKSPMLLMSEPTLFKLPVRVLHGKVVETSGYPPSVWGPRARSLTSLRPDPQMRKAQPERGEWSRGSVRHEPAGRSLAPSEHRLVGATVLFHWAVLGNHWQEVEKTSEPWLVWLSGLNAGLQTKGSRFDSQSGHMPGLQAKSPVGGVQGACKRQPHMDVPIPLYLLPFPSV